MTRRPIQGFRCAARPTDSNRQCWSCVAAGVVFLVPVLVLYRYLVTWPGCARTIGNDFESLYYRYKVYLLDGLSHLRLPLWSPSEAAGFPFYANPFAQVFYPPNAPLAVLYRLRGGYSYHDHQVFTVIAAVRHLQSRQSRSRETRGGVPIRTGDLAAPNQQTGSVGVCFALRSESMTRPNTTENIARAGGTS